MKTALLFAGLLCVALGCFALHVASGENAAALRADAELPEDDEAPATETKVFEEISGFSKRSGRYYFHQEEAGVVSLWWEAAGGSIPEVLWRKSLDCAPECPHTFLWADFDGDGGKDLLALSGDEYNGLTQVLLQRWTKAGILDFKLALRDDEDLGAVVYLDGGKRPVILLRAGDMVDDNDEPISSDVCSTDIAARAIQTECDRKYTQLSREFASLNFDYGSTVSELSLEAWKDLQVARDAAFAGSGGPSIFNLKVFEPLRVLSAHGDRFIDSTERYSEFLRWRVGLLRRAREQATEPCRRYIDGLLSGM